MPRKFRVPEKKDVKSFVDGGSSEANTQQEKTTENKRNEKKDIKLGLAISSSLHQEIQDAKNDFEEQVGFTVSLNKYLTLLLRKGLLESKSKIV